MGEYATKSQANLNTVLGSIGTAYATGIVGGDCGNGMGLNLGGNRNNCYVTQREQEYIERANAEARRADRLEAEKYSDANDLTLYKELKAEANAESIRLGDLIRALNEEAVRNREEIAVLKSDVRCLSVTNQAEHQALKSSFESALQLEGERRACGDETILTYVKSNYIPGVLKVDADTICPQVQLKCPPVTDVQLVANTVLEALVAAASSKK